MAKSGAPGEIRTPDPLLRSFGVRKSKCLIVCCLQAKTIPKPVLSWATWATTNFDNTYLLIMHPLGTRRNRSGIEGDSIMPACWYLCARPDEERKGSRLGVLSR